MTDHQNQSEGGSSASSGEEATGAHIPELEVLEGETLGPGEQAPKHDAWDGLTDGQGFLTREAFRDLFIKAHQGPGHLLQLETLIRAADLTVTADAADAIYDICRETPLLHWIIKPGSLWFQRITAIGLWAFTIYMGVRLELSMRGDLSPEASGGAHGDDPLAEERARAQAAQGN